MSCNICLHFWQKKRFAGLREGTARYNGSHWTNCLSELFPALAIDLHQDSVAQRRTSLLVGREPNVHFTLWFVYICPLILMAIYCLIYCSELISHCRFIYKQVHWKLKMFRRKTLARIVAMQVDLDSTDWAIRHNLHCPAVILVSTLSTFFDMNFRKNKRKHKFIENSYPWQYFYSFEYNLRAIIK